MSVIARAKTLVLVLLTTVGLTLGVGAVTAAPAAASHTCVDNYEWNNFYVGDGKNYVEYLFDTRGWVVWQSGNWAVKKYTHCGYVYDIVKIKYQWTGYRWVVYNAWRY